jgi:hypothetical protein
MTRARIRGGEKGRQVPGHESSSVLGSFYTVARTAYVAPLPHRRALRTCRVRGRARVSPDAPDPLIHTVCQGRLFIIDKYDKFPNFCVFFAFFSNFCGWFVAQCAIQWWWMRRHQRSLSTFGTSCAWSRSQDGAARLTCRVELSFIAGFAHDRTHHHIRSSTAASSVSAQLSNVPAWGPWYCARMAVLQPHAASGAAG